MFLSPVHRWANWSSVGRYSYRADLDPEFYLANERGEIRSHIRKMYWSTAVLETHSILMNGNGMQPSLFLYCVCHCSFVSLFGVRNIWGFTSRFDVQQSWISICPQNLQWWVREWSGSFTCIRGLQAFSRRVDIYIFIKEEQIGTKLKRNSIQIYIFPWLFLSPYQCSERSDSRNHVTKLRSQILDPAYFRKM